MSVSRSEPTEAEYRRILGFVARRVNSPQDAEDIVQDVFADMASGLAAATVTAPPTLGWMYTVARRRIVDAARRRARVRTVSLELVEPHEAAVNAYGGLVARAFDAALASLPERQRQVVLGRLIQGRSFAEIAAALDTTEEAGRMCFMRGLRQLRREFEKEGLSP